MFGCSTNVPNCTVFSIWGPMGSHWEPGVKVVILVGVLRWKQGKVKRARELRMMFMKLLGPGWVEKGQ